MTLSGRTKSDYAMTNHEITVIDIGQLWNCEHAFQNLCPKSWASLDRTDTNGVRHCTVCDENVTYCTTPDEFVRLGNAGHCVAIPDGHSPSTLQQMMMGRALPEQMRELKERQSRIEEWWTATLKCNPRFASEALATIASAIKSRNRPTPELSPQYRDYLTALGDAIRNGPDSLYLHLRVRPSGKRDNQQNIFKGMRLHFPMTFQEFTKLANRLDNQHPI